MPTISGGDFIFGSADNDVIRFRIDRVFPGLLRPEDEPRPEADSAVRKVEREGFNLQQEPR